jgi:hypothetical protein
MSYSPVRANHCEPTKVCNRPRSRLAPGSRARSSRAAAQVERVLASDGSAVAGDPVPAMAPRPAGRGGAGGGEPCVESDGMDLVEDRIVLIVGFCGSGKSTAAATILKQKNGVLVFDPHGDPAYAWIPNTARTIEKLEDYSRWVREAKSPPVWLRDVPDGRLDPSDALDEFCAKKENPGRS